MAESTFAKYFLTEPFATRFQSEFDPTKPPDISVNEKGMPAGWDHPYTEWIGAITEPWLIVPEPHTHTCAEFLYFFGGNPLDLRDFGAEVELVMGEGDEAETHVITTTTWVYVPPNLPHCPLNFKKVDRPIFFGHTMFAPSYAATRPDWPNGKPAAVS